MASQDQEQGFVHLLAADANGGHEPQVFRIRSNQYLKKLAAAYSIFCQLSPEESEQFEMSTEGHGALDPERLVSAYSFCDGAMVTFTRIAKKRESHSAQDSLVPLDVKIPAEARISHGRGRGGGKAHRALKEELSQKNVKAPLSQAAPEAKGIELESVAVVPHSNAPTGASKPRAKATKRKIKNVQEAVIKANSQGSSSDIQRQNGGKPSVQRGLMRSTTAYTGPAKGWRLYAWLAERKGKPKSVKWRAVSPQRTHAFDSFARLRESVGEGVFAHIHEGMRPQLLPKIKTRRRDLENHGVASPHTPLALASQSCSAKASAKKTRRPEPLPAPAVSTPPRKRQQAVVSPADAPPARRSRTSSMIAPSAKCERSASKQQPKKPLRDVTLCPARSSKIPAKQGLKKLPADLQSMSTQLFEPLQTSAPSSAMDGNGEITSSQLATQAFQPPTNCKRGRTSSQLATEAMQPQRDVKPWECGCQTHLRRHPRCVPAGASQPSIIHICGNQMVFGRLKTCDVVLDSAFAPQMISRRHAVLSVENGVVELQDQGALNGMSVNGKILKSTRALHHGDVITFGTTAEHPELDYIFEERLKLFSRVAQAGA